LAGLETDIGNWAGAPGSGRAIIVVGLAEGGRALARIARADEEDDGRRPANADFCAHRFAVSAAQVRMKMGEIDAVVDDMQLAGGLGKAPGDVIAHHARVADRRLEVRVAEHRGLGGQRVGVPGRDAGERLARQFQPGGMHAVSRAEDVAAGDALVELHQIVATRSDHAPHAAGETSIAPGAAEVEGVAAHPGGFPRPAAGDDLHRHALRPQGVERTRDETLRAAVGRVGLADDGEFHAAK
jgi:hypothetical protein